MEMDYNIFLADANGKTCYDYAIERKDEEMIQFFIQEQKKYSNKYPRTALQRNSIYSSSKYIVNERPDPTEERPLKKPRTKS